MKELQKEVTFEPEMALFGGEDGLLFYEFISKEYKPLLKKGGKLVFEIGYEQAQAVSRIMEREGYGEITVIKDLAGNNRVVYGTN